MSSEVALRPETPIGRLYTRGRGWWLKLESSPRLANRTVVMTWGATRLLLLLGVLLGHRYCDPEFYQYAGKLAAGLWPYRDVHVEYPPVAMVLLLLPALPLLPFSGIAPRPDPAFTGAMTHLPNPDPVRYGAYGVSFAVEMLLIDVATLWLVRRMAARMLPHDRYGLRSGLLYIGLVFASGALLQKFDLVPGALCLLAVGALAENRPRLAWAALALATLIKGFPLLVAPVFAGYQLFGMRGRLRSPALWRWSHPLVEGAAVFGGVIAAWTVLVVLGAGWQPVVETITYHTDRGVEIESLYATVILLVGWLPGLAVRTAFHPGDLSRIVLSPLTSWTWAAYPIALGTFVLGAYAAAGRALMRTRASKLAAMTDAQLLFTSSTAVLLAFVLAFLALPAHYLLVVLPLAAVVRLPHRHIQRAWILALSAIALLGQVLAQPSIWHGLVLLQPWAVTLLTARNIAWTLAFGVLLVALWRWPQRSLHATD